jgi:exosortase/archaeosortase family protein
VLTDVLPSTRHSRALSFAIRGGAWSLGLFGVLRLREVETAGLLPLTQLQARLAEGAFGRPAAPIDVTLACSAADAFALCAGAILAYPASWPARLKGAAGGIALILVLNTLRIGVLGRAAGTPAWFEALHVYLWPALLTLSIAGYVFAWMRRVDTVPDPAPPVAPTLDRVPSTTPFTVPAALLMGTFLVLFVAAAPLYLESAAVLAVAGFITRAAAGALRVAGVPATASGNVLWTARGGFMVTQECLATPLIPVYLAAAIAFSRTGRARAAALAAAVPLFIGLGLARLLVVALPAALIGSPLFLVHAFYQLVLAAVLVFLAARWRHGTGVTAWRRGLLGGGLGGVCVLLLGPPCAAALRWAFTETAPLIDPQGALAFLPAFQFGLYVALSIAAFVTLGWRPFAAGLAVLGLSQIAGFALLQIAAAQAAFLPHVRDVRAWALAGPILVVIALVTHDRPRH